MAPDSAPDLEQMQIKAPTPRKMLGFGAQSELLLPSPATPSYHEFDP